MVLEVVFHSMDQFFSPLLALNPDPSNPFVTIFIIAMIVSIITTLANKYLINHDKMEVLRGEMKVYQDKIREAQKSGDAKAMAKIQSENQDFMQKQSEMMKMQFKPMIVTFAPILLVFYWLTQSVLNKVVISLPPFVYYVLLVPVWKWIYSVLFNYGPGLAEMDPVRFAFVAGWLGWYILCTFTLSQVFRKMIGIKSGM
ncbi:MAG: EMC3/TMCO1 family protein [Methanobrevibacter sp.]|jgi:uncharacterized membrane protein (DUF106 family)|nr:EMC3/TMCO1 family protein [Candidatus Methanoflexus mossambicus]